MWPVLRFRREWWAAINYDFAPDGRPCDDETYDRLPPLPEHLFTGDFGWLTPQAAGPHAYYMKPNPVSKTMLQVLDRRLARSGGALPASFVTFMSSADLQGRMPSTTGNGWEMSDLAPSPVEEHGFLLRFMHDQGCWYRYLYLAPDGTCSVLGSGDLFTPEDEDDEIREWTPRDFLASATWEAPDFEHFAYRYWVENVIGSHPGGELPAPAQTYVRLLQTPGRPPLGIWPTPLRWTGDGPDQAMLW
jgi:hypothetical protein